MLPSEMKKTSYIFIAAVAALLVNLSPARAVVVEETWTAGGGAWTLANQPGWTSGVGGTLLPDPAARHGAALSVTNATSGGLYDSFFYTLFSTPSIELSTNNVIANLDSISFTLTTNSSFGIDSMGLNFNGSRAVDNFSSQSAGEEMGFAMTAYTWTWDVAAYGTADQFSISWQTPSSHTAYTAMSLSQIAAVPEPSAMALAVIAVLGVGLAVRSKKRRMAGGA